MFKCVSAKSTHTHTHIKRIQPKVSNLLTLQSWLLQKQTLNQKQRPLQSSLEACSPSHLTAKHQAALHIKWVSVLASETIFGHRFVEPCPTDARVKISNHVFFFPSLFPQYHRLVECAQQGLPVVACHPGTGSGGRVIEYRSLPGPADTEVMWILWLSTD